MWPMPLACDLVCAQAVCKDLGVTMIAYSPLALGLLSGGYVPGGTLPARPPASQFFPSQVANVTWTLTLSGCVALADTTGKYSGGNLPSGPRAQLFQGLMPKVQPLLDVVEEVAEGRKKTMAQVVGVACRVSHVASSKEPTSWLRLAHWHWQALNWAICQGTIPIPGSRTMQQAEEALGALGWRLSSGEVAELEAAADRVPTIIQNIFATK